MKDCGLIVMWTTCGVGPDWKRHSGLGGGGLALGFEDLGVWWVWMGMGRGMGGTLESGVVAGHEAGVDESDGAGT